MYFAARMCCLHFASVEENLIFHDSNFLFIEFWLTANDRVSSMLAGTNLVKSFSPHFV
jgi:hypothetical protein